MRMLAALLGLAWALGLATAMRARQPDRALGSELAAVPRPALDGLEESVRRQIEQAQSAAEELLSRGSAGAAQRAQWLGDLGMVYHAYAFLRAAAICYEEAARLEPESFRWLYLNALAVEEDGHPDLAAPLFEQALDVEPDSVPALLRLARIDLDANRLARGEELYRRAFALDDQSAVAAAGLGHVAMAREDYSRAADRFRAALAMDPEGRELHYPLAQALTRLGEHDEARRHLERYRPVRMRLRDPLALEVKRLASAARLQLVEGTGLFRDGKYEQALRAFRRAADLDPENVEARINLGTTLFNLGDYGAAVSSYREALALDPQSNQGHYNLGVALERLELHEDALPHLRTAALAEPEDRELLVHLASALRATGELAEARGVYARLAAIDGSREWEFLGEALILDDRGRQAEALAVLENGHREMPSAGRLAHSLARLLAAAADFELRDGDRAVDLALRVFAAQRRPSHAFTVALALAESGRCAEAAEWMHRLVRDAGAVADGSMAAVHAGALRQFEDGPPCRPDPVSWQQPVQPKPRTSGTSRPD